MPQLMGQIRPAEAQPEEEGGQVKKVQHTPAKHGCHHINAHQTVSRRHGVAEQGTDHSTPEEQIQQGPQHPAPQPEAEHPQAVIEDSGSGPQQQGTEKALGLSRIGEGHQRKRRAKRPPACSIRSS